MRRISILCLLSISLVIILTLAGCTQHSAEPNQQSPLVSPGGQYIAPPVELYPPYAQEDLHPTPTTMTHRSSMGELESGWSIPEIPEAFRGDWHLQSMTNAPLASEFGPDYSSLVFRLARLPADCRVLLDEPDGLREIGTMPYVDLDGGELFAVFTGDFHLTYSLQVRQTAGGEVVGIFDHSGSGLVYYVGDVRLVTP